MKEKVPISSKSADSTPCSVLPEKIVRLVQGLYLRSPDEGFGGLYLRTYRVRLNESKFSPRHIMAEWKDHFTDFWPEGNYFIPCNPNLEHNTLAVILLTLPMGMRVITGARVILSDETSFTLSTLQGHMFAGWISFSAFIENNAPVIQVQALIRPGDPLFMLAFLMGLGRAAEDHFWRSALQSLSRYLGHESVVEQVNRTIDPRIQWRFFGNIWYNAGIRSMPGFFGRSLQKILAHEGEALQA